MDKVNQRMRLKNGRQLGFAEFGDPGGVPLVYFHGWPSCRLEAEALDTMCAEMRIRVIAPDRPGLGLSEFQPARKLVDFPADVMELCANLGISRFAVMGVSGGGPYALSCARQLREHLSAALVVCGVGPADAPGATREMVMINRCLLWLARRVPKVAQLIAGSAMAMVWKKGNQALPRHIEVRLPPADREALKSEKLRRILTAASSEAMRNGARGPAADGLIYGRPWGFELNEIKAPVFLWHGEADVIVPAAMGHFLAEQIPGCIARFYPKDGHFSLPFEKGREILSVSLE